MFNVQNYNNDQGASKREEINKLTRSPCPNNHLIPPPPPPTTHIYFTLKCIQVGYPDISVLSQCHSLPPHNYLYWSKTTNFLPETASYHPTHLLLLYIANQNNNNYYNLFSIIKVYFAIFN